MWGGFRRRGRDEGFTLLELMVVVLIIAILMAIAIPSYFGTVRRSKDRAAQSNLRNAMTAARTIATEHQGLFMDPDTGNPIDDASLESAEGALQILDGGEFVDAGQADVRAVSVKTATDGYQIVFVTKSESGRYFCIRVDDQGRTFFARGSSEAALNGEFTDCSGRSFNDRVT